MTNYVIILYKLSAIEPDKDESFSIRFSSDTYLLGNIKEMISDVLRYEISLIQNIITIGGPDLAVDYYEAEITRLNENLMIYSHITNPFQIPNGEEINSFTEIYNPPNNSTFLFNDRGAEHFEYFISIQPYHSQQLNFKIHDPVFFTG